MTIECYYHRCRFHGTRETPPDEGPFCHQSECKATPSELETFALGRKLELQGYNLNDLELDNPYNTGVLK